MRREREIKRLSVSDTFKSLNPKDGNTRYMIVEHRRTGELTDDKTHYVCLNTGVIYSKPLTSRYIVQPVHMVAEDDKSLVLA